MKATIKVQYINQPRPGKKLGSVKTEDGRYFQVWPDKLSSFQPGGTYEVEYESSQFNGKTYDKVTSIAAVNGSATPAGNGANNGSDRSNRIERQHSQAMAIAWLALIKEPGGVATQALLRKTIDMFQRDVSNAPGLPTKTELWQEPEQAHPISNQGEDAFVL